MGLKFQHFLFFILFWHFFENFSILEVEIGRNGPGILGVNGRGTNVANKFHHTHSKNPSPLYNRWKSL
jgi:hypothetical protein